MGEKTYPQDDGRRDPLERLESICNIIRRFLQIGLVLQVLAVVAFVCVSAQTGVLKALTMGDGSSDLAQLPGSVGNLVSLCLTIPALWLGQRMCERVARDHRPFERDCASDLYKCGILMLLAGFVPCLVSLPFAIAVPGGADPAAPQVTLAMSGAIVIAVSRILDYGCILQAQDDGLV